MSCFEGFDKLSSDEQLSYYEKRYELITRFSEKKEAVTELNELKQLVISDKCSLSLEKKESTLGQINGYLKKLRKKK